MSRSYSRIPYPPSQDSFQRGGKEPAKSPPKFPTSLPSTGDSDSDNPQMGKMKAAFVTLIRNHELWEIVASIREIEDRFNHRYHYPWVFLNDVPFTDEFIEMTTLSTSGKTQYGMTPLILMTLS